VALLDADEDSLVNIEEMEVVLFDMCEYWNTDYSRPGKICQPEPEANSVSYDVCQMEEDLFRAFFHLSD
jgi:hypothetical protein